MLITKKIFIKKENILNKGVRDIEDSELLYESIEQIRTTSPIVTFNENRIAISTGKDYPVFYIDGTTDSYKTMYEWFTIIAKAVEELKSITLEIVKINTRYVIEQNYLRKVIVKEN